jgi:hypothetical protein
MKILIIILMNLICLSSFALESVFFIQPQHRRKVTKTFHVKMGVDGRTICEAGKDPVDKSCGHHHIIIDGGPIPSGDVIPVDSNHLHFGKGQTETEITLPPGRHTLTLQFADFSHKSYGPKLSSTIIVIVQK